MVSNNPCRLICDETEKVNISKQTSSNYSDTNNLLRVIWDQVLLSIRSEMDTITPDQSGPGSDGNEVGSPQTSELKPDHWIKLLAYPGQRFVKSLPPLQ